MVVTRWFTGGEKHPQTAAALPVRLAMSCCRWAAHKKTPWEKHLLLPRSMSMTARRP